MKECNFPDFGVLIIKGLSFWDTVVPSFVVWDIHCMAINKNATCLPLEHIAHFRSAMILCHVALCCV